MEVYVQINKAKDGSYSCIADKPIGRAIITGTGNTYQECIDDFIEGYLSVKEEDAMNTPEIKASFYYNENLVREYESSVVDTSYDSFRYKTITDAVDTFGIASQSMMLMEECAELINVVAKMKRERDTKEHLAEEIADVRIMCDQLELAYGLHGKCEEYDNGKIRRLRQLIDEARRKNDGNE